MGPVLYDALTVAPINKRDWWNGSTYRKRVELNSGHIYCFSLNHDQFFAKIQILDVRMLRSEHYLTVVKFRYAIQLNGTQYFD